MPKTKPIPGTLPDRTAPIAAGLIADFLANEGGGASVRDPFGGHAGVFGPGVSWAPGSTGPALSFPASTTGGANAVDLGAGPAFTPAALTVAARVKANSALGSTWQMIAGRGSPFVTWSWMLTFDGADIHFYSTGSAFASFASPSKDQWLDVVATWDGATNRIYVNGVEGTPSTNTGTLDTGARSAAIGRGSSGAGSFTTSDSFGGLIERVTIWGRAFSRAEATAYSTGANRYAPYESAATYRAAGVATGGPIEGSATLPGIATLAGSGALAGSAAPGSVAAMSGSGVLAGSASPGAVATLAGSGVLAGSGSMPGVATLAGSLSPAGGASLIAVATLAGSAALAGSGAIGATATLAATPAAITGRAAARMPALARLWWFLQDVAPDVPATLPDDLLGAVKARFLGTPALAGAIAGGIYLDESPRNLDAPCVVVEERRASLELFTSDSQVHDTRLVFKVYGGSDVVAGANGNLVEAAFKDRPLFWVLGAAGKLVLRDRAHARGRWWAQQGRDSWHLKLEFQCRVRRGR